MGNMKLYMAPGSCTTALNILLEEMGEVFEAHVVNLPRGDHLTPDFLALNPKGSIPVLVRRDGTVMTELLAIAVWLGQASRRFWPEDPAAQTRALEIMSHVTATIHGQGFARIFSAGAFGSDPGTQAMGRRIVAAGFDWLETVLPPEGYAAGSYSAADPVLFYVEFWAAKTRVAMPPKLLAHFRLMLARPVVSRVLKEEGYRPEQLLEEA
ncbi:glutathione S-transferase family protein [Poseidonocella sp. HB161398]|uniref:glutathione S-transferase family protein n=1 Tax=Poseidonocella sp. HB161398 TaxID=2320855 RepID=UPI001981717D|nr:glutathione S-transferase [Poseidonocella sp. HB161398]